LPIPLPLAIRLRKSVRPPNQSALICPSLDCDKKATMSEKNILAKMTLEKNRLVNEVIFRFLGHTPSKEERRTFKVTHRLGESSIYHKGKFIGTVHFHSKDDPQG
jgi:hypothetical protein